MLYRKIRIDNHNLDLRNVGMVFIYEEGKLRKIKRGEILERHYGDWTLITSVIDENNFECYSGEEGILKLAEQQKSSG